jgi:hypothetical protein
LSTSSSQPPPPHDNSHHLQFLRNDPRRSDWRSVLAPFAASMGDSMVADKSALSEVLNVAWGMHEMSRDLVKESFEFILSYPHQTIHQQIQ